MPRLSVVGILSLQLGEDVKRQTRDLAAGQGMHTPKGVVHAFANPFAESAKALIALSPDIGAQSFRDIAAVVNTGGPPDKAALLAVMRAMAWCRPCRGKGRGRASQPAMGRSAATHAVPGGVALAMRNRCSAQRAGTCRPMPAAAGRSTRSASSEAIGQAQ